MRRVALVALLAAALAAPASSSAHKQAPAPGAACTWQQNGLEEDGWICLCQRVRIRSEWSVMCNWHLADTVDGRIEAKKSKPKKPSAPKVRVLVRPVIA